MDDKELLNNLSDLLFHLQERLQFLWHFYFGTILAILVLIGSVTDGQISIINHYKLKIPATLIFLCFMGGNLGGLLKYSHRQREVIKTIQDMSLEKTNSYIVIILKLYSKNTVKAVYIGHIICNLIVLGAIWFLLNPKP